MKTITEPTTVQEAITLMAEIKNKGFADVITLFDSFDCVNKFSIGLHIPKWVSGSPALISFIICLDYLAENSKVIESLKKYAKNGFTNDPEMATAKQIAIDRKLALIHKLQKEIAEENN
jgi:hypothetical protein